MFQLDGTIRIKVKVERDLPPSKENRLRKLMKMSSSWNLSCHLMYEKGSKWHAL